LTDFFKKGSVFLVFIYMAVYLTGCGEPEKEKAPSFLIKTSSMIITAREFSEELDMKRAAYPYNIKENLAEYNKMVIDLAKTLSEEIILLSAAAQKGVIVTDKEVSIAENEFRKDYPGDSFDQIMLENAISYSFWKKRFKKNMIMDKFIDRELKQKIEITSRDIIEFYKKNSMKDPHDPYHRAAALKKIENEKELVSNLRMQKTQDHYDEWIQKLGKDYPVEINKEKLKSFLIGIKKIKGSKNEKEN